MKVTFSNPSTCATLSGRARLSRLLKQAGALAGLPVGDAALHLHVVFAGSGQIAVMNRRFLGHVGPTDVLAFDLRPGRATAVLPGDEEPADADLEVYVCPQVARAASGRYGTTPESELLLYLVHGILHLAGYDDLVPVAKRRMRRAEKRIMHTLASGWQAGELFGFRS